MPKIKILDFVKCFDRSIYDFGKLIATFIRHDLKHVVNLSK